MCIRDRNLFNVKENYNSLLSIPGTIKTVNLLNDELPYNGIWTSSMILTFVLALSGIQLAPNVSMITYASKDPGYFATQQIWFSGFLLGFVLMFFTIVIGLGSVLLGGRGAIYTSGNNLSKIIPESLFPNEILNVVPSIINVTGDYSPLLFGVLAICSLVFLAITWRKSMAELYFVFLIQIVQKLYWLLKEFLLLPKQK